MSTGASISLIIAGVLTLVISVAWLARTADKWNLQNAQCVKAGWHYYDRSMKECAKVVWPSSPARIPPPCEKE